MTGQISIAVTGATGFIGTHLLESLRSEGFKTRALYRSKIPDISNAETKWVKGDIEHVSSLLNFFDDSKVCINLAGATTAASTAGY